MPEHAPKSQQPNLTAKPEVIQRKSNQTGLPDRLKSGLESLSGYAMDDVRVHYNSPAPAQVGAHAYTQGSQIHVAPGQERHLAHEAWHVAQQAEGRVQTTRQLKGIKINDDSALEKEADQMGEKAVKLGDAAPVQRMALRPLASSPKPVLQGKFNPSGRTYSPVDAEPDYQTDSVHSGSSDAGCATESKITFDHQSDYRPAKDLDQMAHWATYGGLRLLQDPASSSGNKLTRMHQINGKFFGQSIAANMFLGTSKSNLFDENSHYKQVEKPIRQFITNKLDSPVKFGDVRLQPAGVTYAIKPTFDASPPEYLSEKIDRIQNSTDKQNFKKWIAGAIPKSYKCYATYYAKDQASGQVYKSDEEISDTLDPLIGSGQAAPEVHGVALHQDDAMEVEPTILGDIEAMFEIMKEENRHKEVDKETFKQELYDATSPGHPGHLPELWHAVDLFVEEKAH